MKNLVARGGVAFDSTAALRHRPVTELRRAGTLTQSRLTASRAANSIRA